MNFIKQTPILSGFGPQTTVKEILENFDFTGEIAVVTGGYSGIGLRLRAHWQMRAP